MAKRMPVNPIDPYAENAKRTPEERREYARRAGLASGAARQKRKRMRETFDEWLKAGVTAEDLLAVMDGAGVDKDHQTYQTAIVLSALGKASRGDIEAARFVRDTVGEKPTEQYNIATSDKPIKALDLSGMSDEELEALADSVDE
jgi:hypothetical protein